MQVPSFASQPEPRETRSAGTPLLLLAGALSGATLVGADALVRTGWPYFSAPQHLLGSLALYLAVGSLLGLFAAALIALERRLVGRHVKGRRPALRALRPAFYGLVGGLASISTAIWTFSGEKAQTSWISTAGPIVFATGFGVFAAIGALAVFGALAAIARRSPAWIAVAAGLVVLGALASAADLTLYVALYSRVHTILELVAALCLGAAYAIALARAARAPLVARAVRVAGVAFGAWLACAVALAPVRVWLDETLRHVWLEEVYVGRMLRRVQVAEAFLSDPFHWPGIHMSRVERLKARYGFRDVSLAPRWSAPLAEPAPVWNALRALRGGQNRYNVVVYYVDTLRADVASDPRTMPELEKFRARALDFRRAYATGSDTLRSLPALTGGNYDVFRTPPNDILRVARRADYETTLLIAKSAHEFLGKLRPEFDFDQRRVVEDYPAEQQVWGYGAQRPTAPALVDGAIEYLDARRRDRPFLLWLFNFDQHNWRELDAEYVDGAAKEFGIVEEPEREPYRYRAVARTIDRQFSRLLQALEQRKLADSTVVLFVSDHGEALGRDGFWVHSVFLWESLVHVPLVLRVPRLAPRAIDAKVSLVDVAPTLGRYMDPTLDGRGFHGEDLLSHLLSPPPARRFPLLLVGASKDMLVRVGFVDPKDEFKLVVSFESSLPELYDLRASDPDGENFAARHAARTRRGLELLVHSPIFPREPGDFDVRDTKEQKEAAALAEAASGGE